MENYLKRLPLALFIAYTVKLLAHGVSFSDAPILLVLAAVYAYNEYKIENKQLKEINQQVQLLTAKLATFDKDIKDAKDAVSSIKLSNTYRAAVR